MNLRALSGVARLPWLRFFVFTVRECYRLCEQHGSGLTGEQMATRLKGFLDGAMAYTFAAEMLQAWYHQELHKICVKVEGCGPRTDAVFEADMTEAEEMIRSLLAKMGSSAVTSTGYASLVHINSRRRLRRYTSAVHADSHEDESCHDSSNNPPG